MNAADFNDDPGATGEAEPICELCGASIGIFLGGAGNAQADQTHDLERTVTGSPALDSCQGRSRQKSNK